MITWLRRVWFLPCADSTAVVSNARDDAPVDPEDAWKVLSNVNEWVKHAEAKLGVALAFLGVLAAGLITLVIEIGRPSTAMLWIEGVTGTLLVLASGAASLGLLPQFVHERDENKANPIYYGDIGRYFRYRQDYVTHLKATLRDDERVVSDLARQIAANSAVAVRKYTWANRAILLGFLSVLGLVAVVVGLVLCW